MEALTCKMCGSTNLKKEGDEYTCLSCGTKYHYNDFIRDNGTENCDNEELDDELQRLKAHLREDYSLADRILSLDAGDPEAYFVKYREDILNIGSILHEVCLFNFLGILKDANFDQKDKEEILTYWFYGHHLNEMNNIIDLCNKINASDKCNYITQLRQSDASVVRSAIEQFDRIELFNNVLPGLGCYLQDFNSNLLIILGDDYSDFVDAQMTTINDTMKSTHDVLNEFILQAEEIRAQLRAVEYLQADAEARRERVLQGEPEIERKERSRRVIIGITVFICVCIGVVLGIKYRSTFRGNYRLSGFPDYVYCGTLDVDGNNISIFYWNELDANESVQANGIWEREKDHFKITLNEINESDRFKNKHEGASRLDPFPSTWYVFRKRGGAFKYYITDDEGGYFNQHTLYH